MRKRQAKKNWRKVIRQCLESSRCPVCRGKAISLFKGQMLGYVVCECLSGAPVDVYPNEAAARQALALRVVPMLAN